MTPTTASISTIVQPRARIVKPRARIAKPRSADRFWQAVSVRFMSSSFLSVRILPRAGGGSEARPRRAGRLDRLARLAATPAAAGQDIAIVMRNSAFDLVFATRVRRSSIASITFMSLTTLRRRTMSSCSFGSRRSSSRRVPEAPMLIAG